MISAGRQVAFMGRLSFHLEMFVAAVTVYVTHSKAESERNLGALSDPKRDPNCRLWKDLAHLLKPPVPMVVTVLDTVKLVYSVPGVYAPPVYSPSVFVPVALPP